MEDGCVCVCVCARSCVRMEGKEVMTNISVIKHRFSYVHILYFPQQHEGISKIIKPRLEIKKRNLKKSFVFKVTHQRKEQHLNLSDSLLPNSNSKFLSFHSWG